MNSVIQSSTLEIKNDIFRCFDVGDLLPGCELLVNISSSIISLVKRDVRHENSILAQRIVTETEMRVLLPLLASPGCCPQEVLQASYHYPFEELQLALFSTDVHIRMYWRERIRMYHQRLLDAQEAGKRRAEMRGVYNALFGLRQKLEQFGITIRARKEGYYLSLLHS
ncbi:hypothetical protein [Dictyobacter kobayashii]|uniref:Uncharacterized protein n=1 Tax=Dictyobacter kobayashii TaxID=2014872 RepID=A0A402AQH8_9CHLR|nr:hypothetical protein [Dictyobacter kobayashii]GCE21260.1 hypothetical protein KDK_50600 [Dictyobacter kobayashii]